MARKSIKLLVPALMLVAFLAGCAAHQPDPCFKPKDISAQVAPDLSNQKIMNFIFMLDMTQSMTAKQGFGELSNFNKGWNIISNINRTMPTQLSMMGAMRVVGGTVETLKQDSYRVYGPEKWEQELFKEALETVVFPEAVTPIGLGVALAAEDMSYASGPVAFIILSDGENTNGDPVMAAKMLKQAYQDQVCFYVITLGDNPAGEKLMQELAEIGGCGFAIPAASLADPEGVAEFVEAVFLQ